MPTTSMKVQKSDLENHFKISKKAGPLTLALMMEVNPTTVTGWMNFREKDRLGVKREVPYFRVSQLNYERLMFIFKTFREMSTQDRRPSKLTITNHCIKELHPKWKQKASRAAAASGEEGMAAQMPWMRCFCPRLRKGGRRTAPPITEWPGNAPWKKPTEWNLWSKDAQPKEARQPKTSEEHIRHALRPLEPVPAGSNGSILVPATHNGESEEDSSHSVKAHLVTQEELESLLEVVKGLHLLGARFPEVKKHGAGVLRELGGLLSTAETIDS